LTPSRIAGCFFNTGCSSAGSMPTQITSAEHHHGAEFLAGEPLHQGASTRAAM
jgi:hypothetical protein